MRVIVILAALLCAVCLAAQADARPKHRHRHHFVDATKMVGCSDPVMRPCLTGGAELRSVPVKTRKKSNKHGIFASAPGNFGTAYRLAGAGKVIGIPPPGLRRVMAEGAGRVVNWVKPRAWCGWWMRKHLGVANPAGNRARWWAGYGRPAHGPHVGAIVVWRHHVGKITGRATDGRWIVKSGNDGNRVRERPRSVAGAIAFRWP